MLSALNENDSCAGHPDEDRGLLLVAGFALSHALWSISDGGPLCTLALLDGPPADRYSDIAVANVAVSIRGQPYTLLRFEASSVEESIRQAHTLLDGAGVRRWALAWDGYLTSQDAREDAIFVELPDGRKVAQRYQPRTMQAAFGPVGEALLVSDGRIDDLPEDLRAWLQQGIEAHGRTSRAQPLRRWAA
jgi:hypothetical protein